MKFPDEDEICCGYITSQVFFGKIIPVPGQEVIVIYIHDDSRKDAIFCAEPGLAPAENRMVVGVMVNFPVQEYALCDAIRVVFEMTAFHSIGDEIAEHYIFVFSGEV